MRRTRNRVVMVRPRPKLRRASRKRRERMGRLADALFASVVMAAEVTRIQFDPSITETDRVLSMTSTIVDGAERVTAVLRGERHDGTGLFWRGRSEGRAAKAMRLAIEDAVDPGLPNVWGRE